MIGEEALNAAIQHALAEYPRESVGYVARETYFPMENVATGENEFEVSEGASLAAFGDGVQVLLHSHPTGKATPSAADMCYQEEAGVPWGIIVLHPSDEKLGRPQPAFKEIFYFGDQLPIAPYEGRQFRHGVYDCYALARDWYRQERGWMLPYFPREDGWWFDGVDLISKSLEEAGFCPVAREDVREGDGVLMAIGFRPGQAQVNHCGVYLGNGTMLHHCARRVSKIEPVAMWMQHHVTGFVRYLGA